MDDFWYDISQLWVGTFFYGIYLILFCICIYILLNRPRNLGNTILLVTAIALFTLATVQAIINLVLGAADIDDIDIPYQQLVDGTDVVYAINNFIADGLVIYRCYVVWDHNVFVTILPIMMLIVTTVLGLIVSFSFTLSVYPFYALSLATNVLVTMLTVGRIWWISRYSRAYLKTAEQRRYLSAMAILIESGALYSATVLAFIIILSIPSVSVVAEPIYQMQIQIMGIAPTLIIVRAGLAVKGEELKVVDKNVPAIPADVEKGPWIYHTWDN
ncbi:hypothetical protein C8R45DRAFT_982473 [Mycena sanguinolenta]|nr:hypothetical protein C8R45DRAFT_982473 [Mycena sanguinolenta]